MTATTIDEVIAQLDDVIATARREKSRVGFFAAMYRQVTVKVKEGIASGRFEKGDGYADVDLDTSFLTGEG